MLKVNYAMNKSTWIMILLTWFLGNISIHFITPALPELTHYFNSSIRLSQMIISLFLLGKALSMLLWSTLAQRYGRKPIFISGLFLFSLSNLLAAFTSSMLFFLACRFCQGLAVGATLLMGRVMVNDCYNEQRATRHFALLFFVGGIFISLLPMLGALINNYWGWQIALISIAFYGLLLWCGSFTLQETKPEIDPSGTLYASIVLIMQNRLFLRYLLVSALMMAGESAFNTSASFILIQGAHYSFNAYGTTKTAMAIMHLLGTGTCAFLVRYLSSAQLVVCGVRLFAFSTLLMWLFSLGHGSITLTFIIPMMIYYFGTGFIIASTTAAACRPFPKQMATALALTLFCQFNFSALFSFITSLLAIHDAHTFMLLMTGISFLSVLGWTSIKTQSIHMELTR